LELRRKKIEIRVSEVSGVVESCVMGSFVSQNILDMGCVVAEWFTASDVSDLQACKICLGGM
jgi:hypothetical protein